RDVLTDVVQLPAAGRRVPDLSDHAVEGEMPEGIEMTITQTQPRQTFWDTYRRDGYFFREAAMLTIGLGVLIHLLRVIFGDDFAMQYVVTPTTGKILLVPMTYAAITGVLLLVNYRIQF